MLCLLAKALGTACQEEKAGRVDRLCSAMFCLEQAWRPSSPVNFCESLWLPGLLEICVSVESCVRPRVVCPGIIRIVLAFGSAPRNLSG